MDWEQALVIALLGAVGGLVNGIITDNGISFFKRIVVNLTDNPDDARTIFYLGFIGNMFIGAVGAFTFWSLQITSNQQPQIYGVAILSGLGGARFLTSLLESQVARFERDALIDSMVELSEDES